MPYKCKLKQKEASARHYQLHKKNYHQSHKDTIKRRREFVASQMRPCDDCGFYNAAAMDWHHRDPSTKVGAISTLCKSSNMQVIVDELDKCDCLCSNCHRIRHHGA